jgi:hypothetical protein
MWAGAISGRIPPSNYWVIGLITFVAALLGRSAHHLAIASGRWGPDLFLAITFITAVVGAVKGV